MKTLLNKVSIIFAFFLIFSCNKKYNKTVYNLDEDCLITNEIIKDKEGHNYKVVKIGNQYWLQQNLRTTFYNDGSPIGFQVPNNECCILNKKGYFSYPKDLKDSLDGNFYNWHAVITKILAPVGWHVATKDDWKKLKSFVGSESGNKIRAKYGWNDVNTIAGKGIDAFCFSALQTGYKNWGDGYLEKNNLEYPDQNDSVFWTSTIVSTTSCDRDGQNYPYSVILGLANKEILIDSCNCHNFGYSVRCVKD